MSILLDDDDLHARIAIARGELSGLARGLRRELQPLLDSPVEVPREKALLSRAGGRCTIDGSLLRFDPFDARHICDACHREYAGGLHDRFRLYWYQLWLAERTLHAALLGVLLDDEACRLAACALLDQYSMQYLRYPNADNVLGPSRPFFSTYLESIWLLQLCCALDLLERGAACADTSALGGRVRDHLVAPSLELIRSYDEGMSNRQVWNNAAMLAAYRLLDDRVGFERTLLGRSGVEAHLRHALLFDGSWYEGENYHLFAHRGLWYCTQMVSAARAELPGELLARMQEGFASPFRTLLPDLTCPSRRDSQYKVSIRQPRFAESCELGLARADDPRLVGMLARLYDPAIERGETGRSATSADAERNVPATGLTRDDLSWRSLLFARAELPALDIEPLSSDLLPAQGLGILRRDRGDVYVSLDYGHSGGGHGHPDRLNFTLCRGARRWFDDPGTGSYVQRSLFWYRSTLAHNAPMVDGHSQPRVHGALIAFDDQGDAGWISARAALAEGFDVTRTIVATRDYVVDEVAWQGDETHEVLLPMHGVVEREGQAGLPAVLNGGPDAEDGFSFLRDVARISLDARRATRLASPAEDDPLRGWLLPSAGMEGFTALAPAPPGVAGLRPVLLARRRASHGRIICVWSWSSDIRAARRDGQAVLVEFANGAVDRHERKGGTWHLQLRHAHGRRHVQLGSACDFLEEPRVDRPVPATAEWIDHDLPVTIDLGEAHYRRSESSWQGAGAPRATISVTRTSIGSVLVSVDVPYSDRLFVPLATENQLDNEPASINGDSVQVYAINGDRSAAFLAIPEPGGALGRRKVDGWANDLSIDGRWRPTAGGYHMELTIHIDPASRSLALDVLINEVTHGRARRRGQLVLSGAHGEFVYLRGDRQDRSRLLHFSLSNA